jgi:hypothetical protein
MSWPVCGIFIAFFSEGNRENSLIKTVCTWPNYKLSTLQIQVRDLQFEPVFSDSEQA